MGLLPPRVFGQVLINEICASNANTAFDPEYYNFPGWIELRNLSSQPFDVGGYSIIYGTDTKQSWTVPAGTIIGGNDYLLLWCDEKGSGLHTNFEMDSDGGDLILKLPNGQIAESLSYPRQPTDVSYGRPGDGTPKWSFLTKPTPGAANESSTSAATLRPPQASVESGTYGSWLEVELIYQGSETSVHYTIDGSEPKFDSPEYEEALVISQTTTLKAKSFANGSLPSETAVFVYFINERETELPVVVLSASPEYLWGNQLGIYVDGNNGMTGPWSNVPVNWYQDWERHARIDLFDSDGQWQFGQDVGISITGGFTRTFPQKSFGIKAREKYGDNWLDYPFFSGKVNSRYGGLLLRNGGNDNALTMFRDALVHSLLADQVDIDYQAYQPAILYINGRYWGIQNIREKVDADYVTSNFGLEGDEIDFLENYSTALAGSTKAYTDYIGGLEKLDMETAAAFEYIASHIDVQEYINYMVAQIYVANKDWPGNNIKLWRPRYDKGKFRWILIDTDFGFDLGKADRAGASHPTLEFATDPDNQGWPNPAWSTYHFRTVLKNPIFRARFIQTMTTAINVIFHPDRVIHFIDSLQNKLEAEIPFHKARWGGSKQDWYKEVQILRDFAIARNAFMKEHIREFFGLDDGIELWLGIHPSGDGVIKVGGVTVNNGPQHLSTYKGLNFSAEAVPKGPNAFDYWTISEWEESVFTLIEQGAEWSYYTQTQPSLTWLNGSADEVDWERGYAPLGYGDNDERTTLWEGNGAAERPITHYFTHSFQLDAGDSLSYVKGRVRYDDGIIIYLNGMEVYRENLPLNEVDHTTLAERNKYGEEIFLDFEIDASLLREGTNWLAAEVHQFSKTSDDLIFDLQLEALYKGPEKVDFYNDPSINFKAERNLRLEAFFIDRDNAPGIVINEISALGSAKITDQYGDSEDWIEIYNAGDIEVNLHGYYITDDLDRKDKFKLLGADGQLCLAPGHYLLFWADQETNEGGNHLNFKLAADGEEVGLYRSDGGIMETLDEVIFTSHPDNHSFARIPNGTGALDMTSSTTPRSRNSLYGIGKYDIHLYPNPVESGAYVYSINEIDQVLVFDVMGALVQKLKPGSEGYLNLSSIQPGVYVLNIFSGSEVEQVKIIKL